MEVGTNNENRPLLSKGKFGKNVPWGVQWRSSSWYITGIVAVAVATDMLCYMIVVPILPFRLQALGYKDISQHVSWLLFAYSAGIFTCIFPVAFFFHRYPYRRGPMIAAVCVLQAALFIFMKVEVFSAMIVARFLQGAASSVVFSVGFALICENVPQKHVGRQIGFAMSGSSVGLLIAPPIGGSLYTHFGWNAPFLFCITLCCVDLVARLFVIEQRDLPKYGLESIKEQEARESGVEAEVEEEVEELSLFGVIKALGSNRRGMTGVMMTAIFGLVDGALDPTLTLRVSEVWHKDSDFIGLIYLTAAIPAFFTGPLFGHLADKFGSEFVMPPMLILTIPWLVLLLLKSSLPGFIVFYALTSFFLNSAIAPNGLEVSMGARETKGISEIHQFAAFNLAYATASALGAIAGGQMYDRTSIGWAAVVWFCIAACAVGVPLTGMMAGKRPLFRRIMDFRRQQNIKEDLE